MKLLDNPFASRSQLQPIICNAEPKRIRAITRQRGLDAAAGLFILAGLYMVVAPFTLLIPSHASDKSRPAHARFHVTWAAGKLLGVGISQLLVATFALRKGEIPSLWRHDRSTLAGLLCLLGTVVGLGLAWKPIFGATDPVSREALTGAGKGCGR